MKVLKSVRFKKILHNVNKMRSVVKQAVLSIVFTRRRIDPESGIKPCVDSHKSSYLVNAFFCKPVVSCKTPFVVHKNGNSIQSRLFENLHSLHGIQGDGLFQNNEFGLCPYRFKGDFKMGTFVHGNNNYIRFNAGKKLRRFGIYLTFSVRLVPFFKRRKIRIASGNQPDSPVLLQCHCVACRLLSFFVKTQRESDAPRPNYCRRVDFF